MPRFNGPIEFIAPVPVVSCSPTVRDKTGRIGVGNLFGAEIDYLALARVIGVSPIGVSQHGEFLRISILNQLFAVINTISVRPKE